MITITHTLKGHSSADPDDPGEPTHYRLEFTDQHRKGWTTTADPDVPIRLLVPTLERAFKLAGHTRIDSDMQATVHHIVDVFETSDV